MEQTVFVIDDDESARKSVAMLVAPMGINTELFASAEEFLDQVDVARPECVVTDVRLPGMSGLELQKKLAKVGVALPMIIISGYADVHCGVRAMKDGAVMFLEKPCRSHELWDTIREALQLDVQRREADQRRHDLSQRIAALTIKERQVLDLLLIGKTHKSIASELDVSVRTVEVRKSQILKKMKVKTLVELGVLISTEVHTPNPDA